MGNSICPAEFALGENKKVLIASIPEGNDRPLKYPLMFHEVDVALINKIDLLPHLKFDTDAFYPAVKGKNKKVEIFPVSCTTGQGMEEWIAWLLGQMGKRI